MDLYCEICGGSGKITLPVRSKSSVSYEANSGLAPLVSARTYPCPECGDSVSETRVAVVKECTQVDARHGGEDFENHVMHVAVLEIADKLLRADLIMFEKGNVDTSRLTYQLRASVGVVSKNTIASMEERIAARQIELARTLAVDIKKCVSNWGSHYGTENVPKGAVYDFIREALCRLQNQSSK